MKRSFFLALIMYFSYNGYGQYFNINLGQPDPYVNLIAQRALPFQDSLWLLNLYCDRYVPVDRVFYYTLPIINSKGEVKEEYILGDTTNFFAYLDIIKSKSSEYKILVKDYTLDGDPYYDLQTFDNNLIKISTIEIAVSRNEVSTGAMKETNDGNLIFCGNIQNYNKIKKGYEESQAILYKLDSDGNEIWHTEYGDSINYEKFYDFIEDDQGNIYAVGQWVEPYFDGDYQSLLVKYDKDGTLLWSKLYGSENDLNSFSHLEILSDGKLTILGGYKRNTNKFPFDKRFGKMEYYKYDLDGNFISNKSYQQYSSELYDCVKDSADNLICAGQTYEPDDKKTRGFVAKFNADGDTLWTRRYDTFLNGVEKSCVFYGIVASKDKGYILTGGRFAWFGAPPNNYQGWVVKVDSLGYDHYQLSPVATYEPVEADQEPIITFYPNPTSGELFYRYKDVYMIERKTWVVSFYDLQGIEVKSFEMNPFTNSLQLSSLPDGVYPYIIRTKDQQFVKSGKVVVKRR